MISFRFWLRAFASINKYCFGFLLSVGMKKYGLQLRVPPSQQKKPPRPPLPTANIFGDDEEEAEVNVEKEILLQANKKKSLKDVSEILDQLFFFSLLF